MKALIFLLALAVPGVAAAERGEIEISAAEYGDDWPFAVEGGFSVEEGKIRCVWLPPDDHAIVLATPSGVVALNDTARMAITDPDPYRAITSLRDNYELRERNPDGSFSYGDAAIQDMIDRGLELC